MFVDYYGLLEISPSSTTEEIKQAFRRQALKWHPDRHSGSDTTRRMQLLNEAKLILLDGEARVKYDVQYFRFWQHQNEKQQQQEHRHETFEQKEDAKKKGFNEYRTDQTYAYTDFDIDDDVLKRWMSNARRQAVDLAKQTIEELKGMTSAGIKAGAKAMGNAFITYLVIGVIVLFIIGLSRSCK